MSDDFAPEPIDSPVKQCREKTWFAIKLRDPSGKPMANQEYLIRLEDGRELRGTLDARGSAGIDGIDPGKCTVSFPGLERAARNQR